MQWNAELEEPTLARTQIAVGGFTIPVVLIEVPNFVELFGVLGRGTRQFPVKLLRQLREQVYDLVLSNQPTDRISVIDIDEATPSDQIDFVMGVGIRERLGARGLVGLHREDLLLDVLREESDYDPRGIVKTTLPEVLRLSSNGATPVYRYLRKGGYLRDDGTLIPDAEVDDRIAQRVADGGGRFVLPAQARVRAERIVQQVGGTLAGLLEASLPLLDLLQAILVVPREDLSLEVLRGALLDRTAAFHGPSGQPTAWAKSVAFYDYCQYGPLPSSSQDKQ